MRVHGRWWLVFVLIAGVRSNAAAQNAPALQGNLGGQGGVQTRDSSQRSAQDFVRLAFERNADLLAARQDIAAARGFLTQARLRPNPGRQA